MNYNRSQLAGNLSTDLKPFVDGSTSGVSGVLTFTEKHGDEYRTESRAFKAHGKCAESMLTAEVRMGTGIFIEGKWARSEHVDARTKERRTFDYLKVMDWRFTNDRKATTT